MTGSRRRSRRRREYEDAKVTDAIGRFAVFARASRVRAFDGTNRRRRLTPGRAPRCGVLSVFNTRGPVDAKWMMRSLERRLRQDARVRGETIRVARAAGGSAGRRSRCSSSSPTRARPWSWNATEPRGEIRRRRRSPRASPRSRPARHPARPPKLKTDVFPPPVLVAGWIRCSKRWRPSPACPRATSCCSSRVRSWSRPSRWQPTACPRRRAPPRPARGASTGTRCTTSRTRNLATSSSTARACSARTPRPRRRNPSRTSPSTRPRRRRRGRTERTRSTTRPRRSFERCPTTRGSSGTTASPRRRCGARRR